VAQKPLSDIDFDKATSTKKKDGSKNGFCSSGCSYNKVLLSYS